MKGKKMGSKKGGSTGKTPKGGGYGKGVGDCGMPRKGM